MIIVLSRFAIADQAITEHVKQAFQHRPHLVDQVSGFIRMEVLIPQQHPNEIWLFTYWQTQEDYQTWHSSPAYKQAHARIPAGLKLIPRSAEIQIFDYLCS